MKHRDIDRAAIEEAAADWFVRRRDGLTPELEAKYQAWLAADSRHASAMAELGSAWELVHVPVAIGRAHEAAQLLDRRANTARRRPYVFAAAGLAAAAALMFAMLPREPAPILEPGRSGVALRPNTETLSDGSTVQLNAGAEIAVEFTPASRAVRLVKGEAHFAVEKDPTRPFVVVAGGVSVRAVGTEFVVRLDSQEIGVLVTEGKVAVEPAIAKKKPYTHHTAEIVPVVLDAGRGIVVAADPEAVSVLPVQSMTPGRIANALAWRDKRVEFTRMPLSAAVTIFNEQNRVQLSVADKTTAALPISGIFWSDDPEAFARLLESGLNVRVTRSGDELVLGGR